MNLRMLLHELAVIAVEIGEDSSAFEDKYHEIESALQEATRWVPVEERLPEDEKFVLLIHDANGLSPRVGYRVGDSWHDPLFTWREMNIPTHWMPLPVPPEGGTK